MPKGIKGFQKGHKVFGGVKTRFNSKRAKLYGFQKGHPRFVENYKKGKDSPIWKGDNVLYYSKHSYVKRLKGKPQKCEFCGTTEIPKGRKQWFEWANVDHKYRRNPEDYIRLCVPCHRKYDKLIK